MHAMTFVFDTRFYPNSCQKFTSQCPNRPSLQGATIGKLVQLNKFQIKPWQEPQGLKKFLCCRLQSSEKVGAGAKKLFLFLFLFHDNNS